MSIRLEGYMQTTQQNAPLKRTMKTRHLIMLSLGGVIGTGLFFNTGTSSPLPGRRERCWLI